MSRRGARPPMPPSILPRAARSSWTTDFDEWRPRDRRTAEQTFRGGSARAFSQSAGNSRSDQSRNQDRAEPPVESQVRILSRRNRPRGDSSKHQARAPSTSTSARPSEPPFRLRPVSALRGAGHPCMKGFLQSEIRLERDPFRHLPSALLRRIAEGDEDRRRVPAGRRGSGVFWSAQSTSISAKPAFPNALRIDWRATCGALQSQLK